MSKSFKLLWLITTALCGPTFAATVTNVNELVAAVSDANARGGNTRISVADGVYTINDTLYINAPGIELVGTSGNPNSVVIQGDAMSDSASVGNVIRVAASDFLLANITVQRGRWHAIQIAGEANADRPVLRNCILRDTYEQLLKVTVDPANPTVRSDGGLVEGCLFEYSAGIGPQWYIGGIDAHSARNWIVRSNVFRDIASPSDSVAEYAVHFWNNSADNLVERNLIIDCDRGIGFGLDGRANQGGAIRNNMIYHVDNGDPFADVPIALVESPNTDVYNNTILLENDFPWSIEYRFSTTRGVTIVNNLANRPVVARDGGTGSVSSNVVNASGAWFRDPQAGDLRLKQPVQGVTDAGVNVAELTDDFDGTLRPIGAGVDIGAHEYGGVGVKKPKPPVITN